MRCEDDSLICVDVKKRGCEAERVICVDTCCVKMMCRCEEGGCEDVYMYSRPPILDEHLRSAVLGNYAKTTLAWSQVSCPQGRRIKGFQPNNIFANHAGPCQTEIRMPQT